MALLDYGSISRVIFTFRRVFGDAKLPTINTILGLQIYAIATGTFKAHLENMVAAGKNHELDNERVDILHTNVAMEDSVLSSSVLVE